MSKLQLLRENITVSNCHRLTEQEMKKYDFNRLRESNVSPASTDIIQLAENLENYSDRNLLESIIKNLKEKGATSEKKLWKLPIARYDNLNGNKRIYPRKLFENIKENQRDAWEGICGLADHPEEDNDPGSFKNSAIVWLDMDIGNNGLVFGIGKFIGPYGGLAEEIIEAGGKVGLSQSGFGEVRSDKTVDPDTYIIERLSDVVINPSQSVFGTIDCAHTPEEFMKDVHQGAELNFNKKQVRETKSQIVQRKIKEMADNLVVNAAAQPGSTGGNNQGAVPPQKKQQPQAGQPAPGQQPVQESVKMSQNRGLSKIEEKAFRKYAEAFVADMGKLDNPIRKLEECTDILSCFDEGNCPDLKLKLEESLLKEKERLEKLVETTVKLEQDFGMETSDIRKNIEHRLAEGLLLKDQTADYEKLVEGLTIRNRNLKAEVDRLQKTLLIRTKLTEKTILNKNKDLVHESSEINRLRERVAQENQNKLILRNKIGKLIESNRQLEKENGLTQSKLNKAVELLRESKKRDSSNKDTIRKQAEIVNKYKGELQKITEQLHQLNENYSACQERHDKLQESFNNYKREVNDTYNPVAHIMPNAAERVGKYLNLRENKGVEVENYWQQLTEQYGELVKPYETEIRDSKTLREAKEKFLKYRSNIDEDFKVGGESPNEYKPRSMSERARITEQLGQVVPSTDGADIEQVNSSFLENLKKQGLY